MYDVARTARDSDHVQRRRNQCNTFRRSSSIRLLILTIRIFTNAYQPIMERDPLLHPYYTINSRQNIFLNEMERAILVEHSVIIPRSEPWFLRAPHSSPLMRSRASRYTHLSWFRAYVTCICCIRVRYTCLWECAHTYTCITSPTRFEISRYRSAVRACLRARPQTLSRIRG